MIFRLRTSLSKHGNVDCGVIFRDQVKFLFFVTFNRKKGSGSSSNDDEDIPDAVLRSSTPETDDLLFCDDESVTEPNPYNWSPWVSSFMINGS